MKRLLGSRTAWIVGVGLRLLVAVTSTSSIHPDEHFQNPEIAAGVVFDYESSGGTLLRTWEWQGSNPCRSIVPVVGTSGIAFATLKLVVGQAPSARQLFYAQRIFMWLASLSTDYAVAKLSPNKRTSLALLATSPVTLTFLLRPFSNALETVILALVLVFFVEWAETRARTPLLCLAAFASLGIFTRITFVAFAAPIAVMLLAKMTNSTFFGPRRSTAIVLASFTFAWTCITCSVIDTIFFGQMSISYALSSVFRDPSALIWTPLNLLRYNASVSNLAEHGIHPRYLHFLVNMPMLFGIGLWPVFEVAQSAIRMARQHSRTRLWLVMIAMPLLLLSIQPHQEPRFLAPLVLPVVILVPSASFFSDRSAKARRRRKVFWTFWLLHSCIFLGLFGYLHQGGLIPNTLKLNDMLRRGDLPGQAQTRHIDLVFWRTFMPPRHLLLPLRRSGASDVRHARINVTDLAGASIDKLVNVLDELAGGSDSARLTLLIAPTSSILRRDTGLQARLQSAALSPLPGGMESKLHLDMDRIGDFVFARAGQRGLGIWFLK
ncbi:hypothetical protein ACM66B_001901 [Microbotryomycetes sp. NB124-2]